MINFDFTLQSIEYFLLIMMRIASFLAVAPLYSRSSVPIRVKIGISFFLSIILYQVLPAQEINYHGLIGFTGIAVKEVITGLLIGYAATICTSIIVMAGHMIDMNIGLSMAMEYNPELKAQVSVSTQFYDTVILLLLLVTNMHTYILRAISDSFLLIPVNGQTFNWDRLLLSMVTYMGNSFVIAFRIVLPVFACIMILNVILGIMSKVSPQMNMFSIGIQLKLLLGLIVIFVTIGLVVHVADFIFEEMKRIMVNVIQGLYAG
ncbi:MAG: flagellar biosynthetic protein FliR [Lachnospiraceae bacterium]